MEVSPCARLRGELSVPGDKSISHRLAMLCGIGAGESAIRNYLRSEDCLATLRAMQTLGATVDAAGGGELRIRGNAGRPRAPAAPLDLGNSGTGIRLLTGLLAGFPVEAVLTGDASVRSRPMRRIQEPLLRMGACVELEGAGGRAPIRVRGGALRAIDYEMPVASAQVKSCVLLAGLRADGTTRVREPLPTRDHTERLLHAMGWPLRARGDWIEIDGAAGAAAPVPAAAWDVPGDISSAAFWLVAAAARDGSELIVRGVGLNPRRTAVLDVLRRMGGDVRVEPRREAADAWEPRGDIVVVGRRLRGTDIGGPEVPNLIDELPVLAAAGALAEGETVIRDAAELRVKESDRIASMAAGLRELGVEVEERPDGMVVCGGGVRAASANLQSRGDHRIAMSLAVLALFAPGPCTVRDIACVDTSYPGFWDDLRRLAEGGA